MILTNESEILFKRGSSIEIKINKFFKKFLADMFSVAPSDQGLLKTKGYYKISTANVFTASYVR